MHILAISQSHLPEPLPVQLQHNPMQLILKGSGVFAINSLVKSFILKQIARQFAIHFARYQVAKSAVIQGGTAAATQLQNYFMLQTTTQIG